MWSSSPPVEPLQRLDCQQEKLSQNATMQLCTSISRDVILFFSKGKSLLLNFSYFIKRKNNLTLLVIGCNRLPSMWFLWESHPALVSQAGVLTATLWNHALVLNFSYLLELLV